MKAAIRFRLFFVLFFVSETLCISCVRHIDKDIYTPPKTSEVSNLKSVDNLLQEAFLSYQQGRLSEVSHKLEAVVHVAPKNTPISSLATLYTMLAFFQKKSGDSAKADTTFKVIQGLFEDLKSRHTELQALSKNLRQFAWHLQITDRLQFWEALRPIITKSIGKAAEADVTWQIAEACNGLKDFQKAYDLGTEARQLAQESGELISEVNASIVISMSLIGLARYQDVEGPLQEVLPKTEKEPSLRLLVLGARAIIYNAQGRTDFAIQDFREAITLARSLGDPNRLVQLQSGLGNIYLSIGKPREAV